MNQPPLEERVQDGATHTDDLKMVRESEQDGSVLSQCVGTRDTQDAESDTDLTTEIGDFYDLNKGEKLAVIFNHETFDKFNDKLRQELGKNKALMGKNTRSEEEWKRLEMKKRSGTQHDVDRIKKLFEGGLGFKVLVWDNLTKDGIDSKMEWIQRQRGLSCLALFILTHGGEGGQLTASDEYFSLNEDVMAELLPDKSPNLKGKPKMLFIQACQGSRLDSGFQLDDIPRLRRGHYRNEKASFGFPQFADFLIFQASFHDHVSYRRENSGSWFIQELCEKIEASSEGDEIYSIIMKTSRSVALEYQTYTPSHPEYNRKKQMPLAQTTLIRELFLKRAKANDPSPKMLTLDPEDNEIFQYRQLSSPDNLPRSFGAINSKEHLAKVAKSMTEEKWRKLCQVRTKTGWTLAKAINCLHESDDTGPCIYAGDRESYEVFRDVFDPIICEHYDLSPPLLWHLTDTDYSKLKTDLHTNRFMVEVRRNVAGFGMCPGMSKQARIDVERLLKTAISKMTELRSGTYHPLNEKKVLQLQRTENRYVKIDLETADFVRDSPEGRGFFIMKDETFAIVVNAWEHLRFIFVPEQVDSPVSFLEKIKTVIHAVEQAVKAETMVQGSETLCTYPGKGYMQDGHLGYITSNPAWLGTAMKISLAVSVNSTRVEEVRKHCNESGLEIKRIATSIDGGRYEIRNRKTLGITEVQLAQWLIDKTNDLHKKDLLFIDDIF